MNRTLAFIFVVIVVVSLVASVSSITLTSNPTAPCRERFDTPLVKGFNSSSSGASAFEIVFLANSTSMVCVHYTGDLQSDLTPIVRLLVNGSYTPSDSLTVTPLRINATHVAYTMTVAKAMKGVFNVQLPFVCSGPEILFATGYSLHELNDTTLRVPADVYSCPSAIVTGSVVGISNLEVGWVRVVLAQPGLAG